MQLIISLVSFIAGFFVKKKFSESEGLKQQVKQYEEQRQLQKEIKERTLDNHLIDNDTALLQFKKNRANNKSSK
jgi:hypothetical protein